ncbi:energy-coupling factor transporter transmembrane component T family protein [Corynebacterium ulcerans]|uniref:energy-coupling factor transporter transmembrane component T family protein n=1 Tax=Corynebacterium ulcerans TaxID=65058 RepID=UPI000269D5D4|nr:energy-coupling factor transporter transmembrane component T [Corynebacterium ulcerans]AIU92675.1 ABC transport system, permease protein [Corynebacterium ulcerans]AKA97553.1 ABC transport system, permease protein [Corynebacterium ulcerans]KPH74104.1 ABC transporter permease [Corynebacterium ulcerans]BAM28357.1 putative ABC transport system, permease protein [Corynebacterium ulcerans 0102]BBJ72986.1 hypothetical protein CULC0211_21200 [Corynebacterium ulcerans]
MILKQCDPRTVIVAVVVINMSVLSSASTATLFLCAGCAALALSLVRIRYGLWSVAFFLGFYLAYRGILSLPSANTAIAFLAATLMWFSRFSVSVSVGLFALATLTPSNLTSALRRLKLPQWLTIPPVVFLRIVPVILAEARAIYDAMRLRGLRPGVWSWIRRPVQSSGMFMIPLLGAVMRVGDELAAAALIRGLGGESYPTTVTTLRFRVVDAGILSLLLVTVSSLWWSA